MGDVELDYLAIVIGILCTGLALYALSIWLLIISFIMLLFGMSVYNIVAFWALCIGLPLFWKYVHDKEEKEQREREEQKQQRDERTRLHLQLSFLLEKEPAAMT